MYTYTCDVMQSVRVFIFISHHAVEYRSLSDILHAPEHTEWRSAGHTHKYIYMYIHMCIHTHMYRYLFTHIYIHICMYVYIQRLADTRHPHTYIHICIYKETYMYICIYKETLYIHTHIHKYVYMYI